LLFSRKNFFNNDSQALGVKEALAQQRGVFGNVNQRVTSMSTRFPIIDTILNGIYRRKQRDVIVLAVVIAICVIIVYFLW